MQFLYECTHYSHAAIDETKLLILADVPVSKTVVSVEDDTVSTDNDCPEVGDKPITSSVVVGRILLVEAEMLTG